MAHSPHNGPCAAVTSTRRSPSSLTQQAPDGTLVVATWSTPSGRGLLGPLCPRPGVNSPGPALLLQGWVWLLPARGCPHGRLPVNTQELPPHPHPWLTMLHRCCHDLSLDTQGTQCFTPENAQAPALRGKGHRQHHTGRCGATATCLSQVSLLCMGSSARAGCETRLQRGDHRMSSLSPRCLPLAYTDSTQCGLCILLHESCHMTPCLHPLNSFQEG